LYVAAIAVIVNIFEVTTLQWYTIIIFFCYTPGSIGPGIKNKEKDQKQMWNG